MKKFFFGLIAVSFIISAPVLNAQTANRTDILYKSTASIEKRYKRNIGKYLKHTFSDSLIANQENFRDEKGLIKVAKHWTPFEENILFRDTIIIHPAFLPVIFDGKILPKSIDFRLKDSTTYDNKFHLIPADSTFAPQLKKTEQIQNIRKYYYTHYPQFIKLNALNFKKHPVLKETFVEKKNPLQELLSTDNPIEFNIPEIEKIKIKPVYWLINGEHTLHINQNSLSDNWAAGGDNNFRIQNYHKITIVYKKQKIKYNNTIEWKLDFMRISTKNTEDIKHKINITDDYFRSYNVLGVDAFNKWSYSLNLEIKTPLFNSYPITSDVKRTAFFSPLQINTGLGMRYKLEKKSKKDKYRKLEFSMDLSPLSVNYTFVGDNGVDETRFGIEDGRKSKTDLGSTVNMNLNWSFNRYSGFTSRLKYFSNYDKVYVENENKFTMKLNRFLSTSVGLYVRFDDGVPFSKRDAKWGYFQYNQVIGLGLDYKW